MDLYKIRQATTDDIDAIIEIYNSNSKFLINHLRLKAVNNSFITGEMSGMQRANFLSNVIVEIATGAIIGVLDYKPDTIAYLSLIMINSKLKGNRVGTSVYNIFEETMLQSAKTAIRIDVVNDYEGNAVSFWEKQGFIAQNDIKLGWANKESMAVVMVKVLA